MKTLRHHLIKLTCVSAMTGYVTLAQTPIPPRAALLPPPPAVDDLSPDQAARPLAPLLLAQAATPAQEVAIALAPDAPQTTGFAFAGGDGDRFSFDLLGGAPRPRTLVIRARETDQKTLSALEEDLNVMSRILTKAVKEKGTEEDAMTAMGMQIRALTFTPSSTVQNLYLDGYGALFMLHARFPFLPPPEPAKEETRKESSDSTWEEARHELYGPKESMRGFKGVFTKETGREAYDAKKVARLKESLVDALKNATNIRNLKPEEFITIVVIGSENTPVARAWRVGSAGDANQTLAIREYDRVVRGSRESTITLNRSFGGGETIMTIRAKKADVDAYAKGDLKSDDFQKKVSVVVY